ncbi:MAG: DUF711 family protein, partial [Clostridia bacterium]
MKHNEIIETIEMIENQHFDVRTITLGISLFDCIRGTAKETAQMVYDKITKYGEKLVPTAEKLSRELGVPIVNKRVSVTPASMIFAPFKNDYVMLAKALDKAAIELGIDFIGGYTALVHKSFTDSERAFLESIPEALSVTERMCSSVNIASTRAGINMDAVKMMGEIIKKTAYLTNAVEDNPFMAGAFHGVGEGEKVVNVGVSGPGVVKCALEKLKDADMCEIAEEIKKTAFKITRVGQLVAKLAAVELGAEFGIVDLSLAPTPVMGDSVGHILEEIGLESVGACGTTAALAMLNDAVKKGGLMASSSIGGLSGAFIPVSEDIG